MKHGCPKTNWLCPKFSTPWRGTLLRILVSHNHHWTYGMPFVTCMKKKKLYHNFLDSSWGCQPHQEGKPCVQLLGSFKSLWNKLEKYRPHTIDATTLWKRIETDKIFQLLASLSLDFKDLWSHILMNPELSSLKLVCATI